MHEVCGDEDETCKDNFNTKWVTVFEYNGVVLFFLTLSYASVAVGAFFYLARVIGAGCTVFWNCCHIIALIVTASYRFG